MQAMKQGWQKYVFSFCMLIGTVVLIITKEPLTIGVAGLIGIILHFTIGYFSSPKNNS